MYLMIAQATLRQGADLYPTTMAVLTASQAIGLLFAATHWPQVIARGVTRTYGSRRRIVDYASVPAHWRPLADAAPNCLTAGGLPCSSSLTRRGGPACCRSLANLPARRQSFWNYGAVRAQSGMAFSPRPIAGVLLSRFDQQLWCPPLVPTPTMLPCSPRRATFLVCGCAASGLAPLRRAPGANPTARDTRQRRPAAVGIAR